MQTTVISSWFKKDSQPQVKSFPGRTKISYSGFILPDTGELFVAKPDKFNYLTTIESVREFLSAHPVPQGKKYALFMDNAPWHKKTKRLVYDEAQLEYTDILENVVFIMLPPYSPDLNPIEQVWRITGRENTHNTFFTSLSVLESTVDSAFASWAVPNDQLRSLCTFIVNEFSLYVFIFQACLLFS